MRRFAEAECCWLSTVRPDGRPHSAPIWHIWRAGKIYLVSTARAVKTENLRANEAVVVTHPDPLDVIIIEGTGRLIPNVPADLKVDFKAKYDWDIDADREYRTVIEITPTRLIAWGEEGAQKRTRWTAEDLRRLA